MNPTRELRGSHTERVWKQVPAPLPGRAGRFNGRGTPGNGSAVKPAQREAASRSLEDRRLAQLTGMVLDIPPRVRLVLGIVAVTGVALVAMQSLVGRQPGTIHIDKIIHFSGYAILAAMFVMALRPALFLPVLAALVGLSYGIEFLQPLTGRERDIFDAAANTLGVAIGAGAGLLVRGAYAWLRRDLALSAVSRMRMRFRAGVVFMKGR